MTEQTEIKIGIADDEEVIHSSLANVIKRNQINCELFSFYDTAQIKDFLFEKPLLLDILILDVHFYGGETGIEALSKIREYSPGLPIILLTAEKSPEIIELAYPYSIDYLAKPIDEATFIIHLKNSIAKSKENKHVFDNLKIMNDSLVEQQNKIEQLESQGYESIPPDLVLLISQVFIDIDFTKKAIKELCSHLDDERLIRVIRTIDWRIPPKPSANVQIFQSRKKENIWEYRFSKKGRIFVQFRDYQKPLIDSIDYTHSH